jgi:Planctomycete cytochrome C
LAAVPLDPSKLPLPAKTPIDFDQQIKPILEHSCIRCHGPERPKSHFRLDDRVLMLKGGDNGIDVVPGDSAKSPLIYYVARLDPEMAMPPNGKGEPLSELQVSLLRAWIDQGAGWGHSNAPVELTYSVTPMLRVIGVSGDSGKFREIEGMRQGVGGGAERFSFKKQLAPDETLTLDGHAIAPDNDYSVKLELRKTELGFIRGGVDEWRKYYDDTGGFYRPFSPPSFDLNRDLHLDEGKAWIDFGLTIPDLPQIVLGYEYQFRDGNKSTLEWGNIGGKNIYPASEEIHEHTHLAKLDMEYDFFGFHLEDNARVEFYSLNTRHNDAGSFSLGPTPDTRVLTSEGDSHIQGMNTIRLERQVTDWWLLTGGYLYSKLDGDASLNQVTVTALGAPTSGNFWWADGLTLRRESHVVSVSSLFLPEPWFTASGGVQSEWTRQQGSGTVHLDSGDPNLPLGFFQYPATVQSDLDQQQLGENLTLRFTKIPYTVLFAETRLNQERIGQFEEDAPVAGVAPDPTVTFLRNTDYSNYREEARGGFSTSPWTWASLSAHYKKDLSDSDYENSKISLNPNGYPAFIRSRRIDTDEVETKLVLKPSRILKTTLTYQIERTSYDTTTAAVPNGTIPEGLRAGNYDAHVYGIAATLTPVPRFYFSGAFTYSDSRLVTADNGDPAIAPYKGDIYSLIASGTFIVSAKTDLQASYSFSQANYSQGNLSAGLPLGLDYTRHGLMAGITRRLTSSLTTNFRYAWFDYSEPSTGGVNNYSAHGVFASLTYLWP